MEGEFKKLKKQGLIKTLRKLNQPELRIDSQLKGSLAGFPLPSDDGEEMAKTHLVYLHSIQHYLYSLLRKRLPTLPAQCSQDQFSSTAQPSLLSPN
jgi:hypothetical protein